MKRKHIALLSVLPLVCACEIKADSFRHFYIENVEPFYLAFSFDSLGVYMNVDSDSFALRRFELQDIEKVLNETYEDTNFDYYVSFQDVTSVTNQNNETNRKTRYSYLNVDGYESEDASLYLNSENIQDLHEKSSSWQYKYTVSNTLESGSETTFEETTNELSISKKEFFSSANELVFSESSIYFYNYNYLCTSTYVNEGGIETTTSDATASDAAACLYTTIEGNEETKTIDVENHLKTTHSIDKTNDEYETIYSSFDQIATTEYTWGSSIDDIVLHVCTTHRTEVSGEMVSSDCENIEGEESTRVEDLSNLFPESESYKYTRQNLYNLWTTKLESTNVEAKIKEPLLKCKLDIDTAFTDDAVCRSIFDGYSYTLNDFKVVYSFDGYPMTLAYDQPSGRKVYSFSYYFV